MANENLSELRARCEIAAKLWGRTLSALTAMTFREKGNETFQTLWSRILTRHQVGHYSEGLRKLGIRDDEPPAVKAAKYHYFTNLIGGLDMDYVEETPKKVWIRYKAPMWTYAGVAMIALPGATRRTILGSWHPRNGVHMGCMRLGWVATKFIMEGEPYDEGYFIEHERDLLPEEMMRIEVVEHAPEFHPEQAPTLDPELWPEARMLKARRKFSTRYAREAVEILLSMCGEAVTAYIVQQTMRCVAIQYIYELQRDLGLVAKDVKSVASLFAGLAEASLGAVRVERTGEQRYCVAVEKPQPWDGFVPESVRAAFFEFQQMGTRLINGHLRVTRHKASDDKAEESWEFEDIGRWLW
jgi:hypothetical protein